MARGVSPFQNGIAKVPYSVILQTVTVVALFVGAFWVGVIGPMQYEITDLSKTRLTIREHDEFKNRIDRESALLRDEFYRMRAEIREQIVPRGENEAHWQQFDERLRGISSRVEEMQKQYSTAYSVNDQLKNLQKQLDDLRAAHNHNAAAN